MGPNIRSQSRCNGQNKIDNLEMNAAAIARGQVKSPGGTMVDAVRNRDRVDAQSAAATT